ncbi:YppG family protein [Bacillus sp. DTU_2020_1000418_1_SI_GHA_SEK_038]|uniref:YppG family protein n=1 Tax=Bacillus sp. DTU_2020_1000418_1_SI_GHA_SEK_038 TaxID=3077585 RepID=UPI0028E2E8B3|nr:YppG family protein [Bacillus sp. DTU_2020_1000418_1_SI_GHA_SEK_038]WNS73991.1 YppG family protein [Bacillus sp. DTU_2020_1000418_1_SI_GHA_SEK_038]
MFGRRGNRASHYMYQYHPTSINNVEYGLNQNQWRQQPPYYPSPAGNMGFYNSPHNQPFPYGSDMMYQNGFPSMASQNLMYSPFPTNGYPMKQNGMQMGQGNFSQSIFQNPLDPETNQNNSNSFNPYFSNSYMNPYPKQSFIPKQSSGVQSLMNSFKAQDGSIDINKMMNTAGQMVNAVSQVSSLVKGLGGIIKV